MIPSQKWFPSSLQERAAWYDNFSTQIGAIGLTLGIGMTAAEITEVGEDNGNIQALATGSVTLDFFAEAYRQYRKIFTEGDIGDPIPDFPASPTFTLPNPSQPTGAFERLVKLVDRIRTSPVYTDELGALLGIIPQKGDDLAVDELKPALKANAMPGNLVQVDFVRGKTDGVQIETLIDGAGGWANAGKYFKSPAQLNIPNGTGNPHSVQIRARFVMGNNAVGLNSDIIQVVTTP